MFKTPFYSRKNIVVSENPYASYHGLKILEMGGSAVDAAVSISFTLAITLPHLGGFGGDYFALIYDNNRDEIYFINGSGYAASKLSIDYIMDKGFQEMPTHGLYSITIPGFVDAVYTMWKRFGLIEWPKILEKPTKIAEKGFPTSYTLFNSIVKFREHLEKDQGSRITYLSKEINSPGNMIKIPAYHRILTRLSEDPRDFYEGEIMEKMVSYLNSYDMIFNEEDFKRYHSEWDKPLKTPYKDKVIYEMPPNTQGATTLHILKMLENTGFEEYTPDSWERVETFLKTYETAYCIRDKFIGDPRYMDIPPSKFLSNDFLEKTKEVCTSIHRKNIGGDTTYYAVIDSQGNIVSGIQSLFYSFGSYLTEPNYGVTFNSRASSFSLDREDINSLFPGKKPLHTLSSPLIFEGDKIIAHGLSGGYYRPQLHTQIITDMLDYNMDPQEAIEYPRFIWKGNEDKVIVEEGISIPSSKIKKASIVKYGSRLGVAATAILYEDDVKGGYVDIRGEGLALGEA